MASTLTCKDCDQTFSDSVSFGEHFERAKDSIRIVGCKKAAKKQ